MVEERFAGRGLAGQLVSAALADTRAVGKRIVPVCPYVAKYVKSHHDFDDIVDRVTPQALAAVRAAMDSSTRPRRVCVDGRSSGGRHDVHVLSTYADGEAEVNDPGLKARA